MQSTSPSISQRLFPSWIILYQPRKTIILKTIHGVLGFWGFGVFGDLQCENEQMPHAPSPKPQNPKTPKPHE